MSRGVERFRETAMALVKPKDLRELAADDLHGRVARLHKEFYELLQKKETGQLDRPHRFRLIRREIAQCMTLLREKKGASNDAKPKRA